MPYDISVTPDALAKLAEWMHQGPDAAPVEIIVDDRMMLATQGDDRMAWDTDGSPASDAYLALAPLDGPHAMPQPDDGPAPDYVRADNIEIGDVLDAVDPVTVLDIIGDGDRIKFRVVERAGGGSEEWISFPAVETLAVIERGEG